MKLYSTSKFARVWAMPNKHTFSIKPIKELIKRHMKEGEESCDPFSNQSTLAKYRNDLDPSYGTQFNMDALEFLKTFASESLDLVLYDPPYSPRQISECYKKMGRTVNMQTTQSSFWGDMKKEISRVLKDGGTVISFGWNSGGIGKTLGFHTIEILLVAHGGAHNDTICVVEKKGEAR